MNAVVVNNKKYEIIKLLGKGKGGYSYLAKCDEKLFCLKQIHHEPCDYYHFGNKMESELNDYKRLLEIGIDIPMMIDFDLEKEVIIKEFIDGLTIEEMKNKGMLTDNHFNMILNIESICKKNNINIDYYPTNFIFNDGKLYYIDYEINKYDPKWDFQHWGYYYWKKD